MQSSNDNSSNMWRRARKISDSLRKEGLSGYMSRLYHLGQWKRPLLTLLKYRSPRTHIYIHEKEFYLSERWQGITEELVLTGVHEPCATNIYASLLSPGDVVLDIGSNCGYYLSIGDDILKGNGQLHGFEPDPELFSLLRKNTSSFDTTTVLNQCAISASDGKIIFHTSTVSNWGTVKPRDDLQLSGKVEVASKTIDSYCEEKGISPNVIRMDIEGGELLAIKGANNVLKRKPKLFIEFHRAFLTKQETTEFMSILENHGYDEAIWTNRYYDSPYSSGYIRERSVFEGDWGQLTLAIRNSEYPVMGVFLR